LTQLECFVRAAETGSFSAVARSLHTTQPTVSKHIAQLEAQLGVRLLRRSTRKMALTPEGERYYAECRRVLDALAEADANVRGQASAAGLLRVACPPALARHRVMPLIGPFTQRYPGLCVDLLFTNRDPDLIEEGIDVAFHVGSLPNSSLRARWVGAYAMCCAAAPDYLARHGEPQTPAALSEHNCILFTRSRSGLLWTLGNETVAVRGNLRVDNPEGLRSAALLGLGIVIAPTWLFADELHDGRLRCLLEDWPIESLPVHLLFPAKHLLPTRARVFIDFIAEAFLQDPCLNGEAVEALGHGPCRAQLLAQQG
jgi:LysR family transcriptional regulator, regulator for bpeEF and oprC